jgi:hypothetical protein
MRVGRDLPYFESPVDIREFAQGVEAMGYDRLGFSEHVATSRATVLPGGFRHDGPWHETATLTGFSSRPWRPQGWTSNVTAGYRSPGSLGDGET